MKQIPAGILTLIAGILVTLISLWVSQNHTLLPKQASTQAPLVDNFFSLMVVSSTRSNFSFYYSVSSSLRR